jgi:hypothetical protein
MDGLAVEGAVAVDGLPVVQPDPDPDAAVGVPPAGAAGGAGYGGRRSRWGSGERITSWPP